MPARDYGLTGAESRKAVESGLAKAQWYQTPIPRKRMKELMRRDDWHAAINFGIWITALVASGVGGVLTWGTWWAVPFFFVYGTLYGSTADARWHECGHGTAFKTRWINDVIYQVASFMILRNPTVWRWSHTRHHTDTIIVGRDPEIAVPRPPSIPTMLLNLFALKSGPPALGRMFLHAAGRLTKDEATYVPEMERHKVAWEARAWIVVYAAVIGTAIWMQSILPLMLVGLPSFYGAWLISVFGYTQHAGLAEDVPDHRLNTRTVYMNGLCRFLYWNMNYHIEHHMFPMVPFHALPALHEEIKADTPPPYHGLRAAYREIIPAIIRQSREPGWYIVRELPKTAQAAAE